MGHLLCLISLASSTQWGLGTLTHGQRNASEVVFASPKSWHSCRRRDSPWASPHPQLWEALQTLGRTGLPHCSASTEHAISRGPEGCRTEEQRVSVDLQDPHPPREPPCSPSPAQGLFVSATMQGRLLGASSWIWGKAHRSGRPRALLFQFLIIAVTPLAFQMPRRLRGTWPW